MVYWFLFHDSVIRHSFAEHNEFDMDMEKLGETTDKSDASSERSSTVSLQDPEAVAAQANRQNFQQQLRNATAYL